MASNDASTAPGPSSEGSPTNPVILILAWIAVGAPLLWGVLQTFKKAMALFA